MESFPKLNTGAPAQFGSSRELRFHTEVLRFLDGTEQRMVQRRAELQWHLLFDHLTEAEVRSIASFFDQCQGSISEFRFEDPWTGELVENCVFVNDEIEFEWLGPNRARTSVQIRRKGP